MPEFVQNNLKKKSINSHILAIYPSFSRISGSTSPVSILGL